MAARIGGGGVMHVAVVGGGVAGLAAALRLLRRAPDVEVTLFEKQERLGGEIHTEYVDGFVIEAGADSFLTRKAPRRAALRGVGCCRPPGRAAGAARGNVRPLRRCAPPAARGADRHDPDAPRRAGRQHVAVGRGARGACRRMPGAGAGRPARRIDRRIRHAAVRPRRVRAHRRAADGGDLRRQWASG